MDQDRQVRREEGCRLAQQWGCPFYETSAKSKTNVDELFAEIVRETNIMTLQNEEVGGCCTLL